MRLDELDYELPPDRIARTPSEPRDRARLLVLDRATGRMRHLRFRHLAALLSPGDCVVVNDTRVLPARFHVRRRTGGVVEGLFLQAEPDGSWRVLLKGAARLDPGETLDFPPAVGRPDRRLTLGDRLDGGQWLVRCDPPGHPAEVLADRGETPLPPYIVKARKDDHAPEADDRDPERYQTVYADRPGAVAAPTAGLHFTPEVLDELADAGVSLHKVTLHVGLGTFAPVKSDDLSAHRLHAEPFELSPQTAEAVNRTRSAGGRVVAVGTTTVRVLESRADETGRLHPGSGATDLMITPGRPWRVVTGLVTNFHLPRTTLLALVFAFAGRDNTLSAYAEAVRRGYRFYSYGDAMLVL
jgi:S-adenosylmethionine:tRNA ribosyltransferase-isomerase